MGARPLKGLEICIVMFMTWFFRISIRTLCFLPLTEGFTEAGMVGTTCEIVENLPLSQFYQISVDNATPYNIYGGLQDNGSWYGPSASPGGIQARDWNSVGVGDGFQSLKASHKKYYLFRNARRGECLAHRSRQ